MIIKIGRYEYALTHEDRFLDNGACIQLITQSKEKESWGRRAHPVLSKRLAKQLSTIERIDCVDRSESCLEYSLAIGSDVGIPTSEQKQGLTGESK